MLEKGKVTMDLETMTAAELRDLVRLAENKISEKRCNSAVSQPSWIACTLDEGHGEWHEATTNATTHTSAMPQPVTIRWRHDRDEWGRLRTAEFVMEATAQPAVTE